MTSPVLLGGSLQNQNTDLFTSGYYPPVNNARVSPYTGVEAQVAWKIDAAGASALLTMLVTGNTSLIGITITSQVNSAFGNQTIAIGAGATGQFQDTTHSDSILAGNTINYRAQSTDSSHEVVLASNGIKFQGTSVTASVYGGEDTCGGATLNNGNPSQTLFVPIIGSGDNSASWYRGPEANAQEKVVAAGVLSRFGSNISTNTGTNAATVTFRNNAANGNQTFVIGASTTGYLEDTTHTDAVIPNDLINVTTITGAGTVNANQNFVVVTFTSSTTNVDMRLGNTRTAGQNFSSTVTNYMPITGGNMFVVPTESNVQTLFPFTAMFSNLIAKVSGASGTGAQNMVTRKNGVTGNQSISINPGVLGYSQDVTHADQFALNDLVNLMLPAIGGGTLCFSMIGLTGGVQTTITASLTGVAATGSARALTTSASASPTLAHVAAVASARAVSPGFAAFIHGVSATARARATSIRADAGPVLVGARAITQAEPVQGVGQSPSHSHTRTWGTYR